MSETNGAGPKIIRIGNKGREYFAFGEEGHEKGKPFEVDILQVNNDWIDLCESMKDEEGKRPPDYTEKCNAALFRLCSQLSGAPLEGPNSLTLAECLHFIKEVQRQGDKLRVFFEDRSPDAPSSPASSRPEVTYSE